jgi:O-glycosyl hydrolase
MKNVFLVLLAAGLSVGTFAADVSDKGHGHAEKSAEAKTGEGQTVMVDAAATFQVMDGFGTSVRLFEDPHVFNNFDPATGRAKTVMTAAQQDEVLDKLYNELRLSRVRPVNGEGKAGAGIEPVNDNDDPNVTDLSKFDFTFKKLDSHIDLLVRARERGAKTFFLSPVGREAWMGTDVSKNDPAEYAEWLLAQVKRCAERGIRLPFLSVANEPSYSRNHMSGEFIREVIKNLGPRLRAEKFETKFIVPDDVRSSDAAAKTKIILSDPAARQYVGALAAHLYDEPVSNVLQMKALADQYELPLWMTEFSIGGMGSAKLHADALHWGLLMHDLITTYNVSAVDYMWGFFGQWEGEKATLIMLNNRGDAYRDFTLTKTYYITGQFSRFIRPGSRRIKAQSSGQSVKASAYLDDRGLTIVAINMGQVEVKVIFRVSGFPAMAKANVAGVRSSVAENWAALPAVAVDRMSFAATLPPNSITTFTADTSRPADER